MICFLDRTFCSTECGNLECYRNFTPELQAKACLWWGENNIDEVPVCKADYKDTLGCPGYISINVGGYVTADGDSCDGNGRILEA